MTNAAGSRVLVVGAGIAGLATARALARAGFSPEVIEREPASPDAGTGIYLPGNAARALRALGLDAEVAERAVEIPRQRFLDHRGRLLADVDVSQLWAGVGPCLALHRADLHDALREGADDTPIHVGVTLDRLVQRDGKVAAELSDGTPDEYDLVVGADGIHSTVRRLAFGDAPARPLGQLAWRLVAPCPQQVTTWSVMLGRRTAFLMLPIGQGRAYCYCDVDADPGADRSPERLPELLSEFAEPAQAILESIGDVHVSAIEEVALDSWVQGHVVLVGDAAHATSPNMAEGAAMALEDALVLAECLAEVAPIPRALAAFESRRRPRADWVRARTHRATAHASSRQRHATSSCAPPGRASSARTTPRCSPFCSEHSRLRRWRRAAAPAHFEPRLDLCATARQQAMTAAATPLRAAPQTSPRLDLEPLPVATL